MAGEQRVERRVELVIRGVELPGRRDPHVALQVGRDPEGVVPGDAASGEWVTQLRPVESGGVRDVRGPAVQGRRGERFVYLTWGDTAGGGFTMVRRAKLMLDDEILAALATATRAVVTVGLTDAKGQPRAARVPTAATRWEFS